jgi:hypothetical protein
MDGGAQEPWTVSTSFTRRRPAGPVRTATNWTEAPRSPGLYRRHSLGGAQQAPSVQRLIGRGRPGVLDCIDAIHVEAPGRLETNQQRWCQGSQVLSGSPLQAHPFLAAGFNLELRPRPPTSSLLPKSTCSCRFGNPLRNSQVGGRLRPPQYRRRGSAKRFLGSLHGRDLLASVPPRQKRSSIDSLAALDCD